MNSPAPQPLEEHTCHGVFLDVLGAGVMLTGASGIGKSELALGLIDRGHSLIADDAILFSRQLDNTVCGQCPPLLQNLLEIRGLGIIDIYAMYGYAGITTRKTLNLLIRLVQLTSEQLIAINRLSGEYRQAEILGVAFPEVSLPVAPGRPLAILVEAAVRNHILKSKGYDCSAVFQEKQRQQVGKTV